MRASAGFVTTSIQGWEVNPHHQNLVTPSLLCEGRSGPRVSPLPVHGDCRLRALVRWLCARAQVQPPRRLDGLDVVAKVTSLPV
jgi:hypothetical protein